VVSSMPQPHFTPRKDTIPILQEAGWAPGLIWMGGKSRPQRDSNPDHPARSQWLYRQSYPTHTSYIYLPESTTHSYLPANEEWWTESNIYINALKSWASRLMWGMTNRLLRDLKAFMCCENFKPYTGNSLLFKSFMYLSI